MTASDDLSVREVYGYYLAAYAAALTGSPLPELTRGLTTETRAAWLAAAAVAVTDARTPVVAHVSEGECGAEALELLSGGILVVEGNADLAARCRRSPRTRDQLHEEVARLLGVPALA